MFFQKRFTSWLLISCIAFVRASPEKTSRDTFQDEDLLHGTSFEDEKSSTKPESARTYQSNAGARRYVVSTLANQASYSEPPTPASYQTSTATVLTSSNNYVPAIPFYLGSQCANDSYCAGISNSRCLNGVCVCNTMTVSFGTVACFPKANAFGDICAITAQCKGLDPLAICYVSYRTFTTIDTFSIGESTV